MNRLQSMLERLPPIYRIESGALLGDVLGLVSLAMEIFDQDMDRVQRSHWIEDAFDRDDLAKIGALVGVAPEDWEEDELFRARLRAMVAARLQGALTPSVLEEVLTRILMAAQSSLGVRYLRILPDGASGPQAFTSARGEWDQVASLTEFPSVRRRSPELAAQAGLMRPTDHATLTNRGLTAVPLEGVLRGVAGGRTAAPLLVNLTNGTCVGYADVIRCGQELTLTVDGNGRLRGIVDDVDVSARLYTSSQFVAGKPFAPMRPDPDPRPIQLERGDNDLWFISLALFDVPGLDAAMLGVAAADLRQGRWAGRASGPVAAVPGTSFDSSLFLQPPAGVLDLWWDEPQPATFRFDLPAGAVRRVAGERSDPERDRVRLFALLQETVDLLRAAAVDGQVRPRPLGDAQPMHDRCRVLTPDTREPASPGGTCWRR
jgi:hypothetical protein